METKTRIVSATFSADLHSKMSKEDMVMISNGENEISAQPDVTAEGKDKDSCDDLKHPRIPGWFAEHCPIWPGKFPFFTEALKIYDTLTLDYILICFNTLF